jgi:hypothetical protein
MAHVHQYFDFNKLSFGVFWILSTAAVFIFKDIQSGVVFFILSFVFIISIMFVEMAMDQYRHNKGFLK